MFPQFRFIIFDTGMDGRYFSFLKDNFSENYIEFRHVDDIPGFGAQFPQGACHFLGFGNESEKFTFIKLMPLMPADNRTPVIFLWLTFGCQDFEMGDLHAWQRVRCMSMYQNWKVVDCWDFPSKTLRRKRVSESIVPRRFFSPQCYVGCAAVGT